MKILFLGAGFDNMVLIRCEVSRTMCSLCFNCPLPPFIHVKFFVRPLWWWAREVRRFILHEFPDSLFQLHHLSHQQTDILIVIFKHWNKTCDKDKPHFSGKKEGEWGNPTFICWVLIIEQTLCMRHYCLMVRRPKLIKD